LFYALRLFHDFVPIALGDCDPAYWSLQHIC
jgi:hypothetical protein